MAGGNAGLAVGFELYFPAGDKTVTAEYEFAIGIPHYELVAGGVHKVVFVNVTVFSGATAGSAECYFTQSAYFAHCHRGILGVEDIDFIASLIGSSQIMLLFKFTFNDIAVDGVDNLLIHKSIALKYILIL